MLPKLYKDDKVQKDLNRYRLKIRQIPDRSVKEEAEILLKKLKEEIQILEENHKSQLIGEVRPSLCYTNRENINQFRNKLNNILKNYNLYN